MVDGPIVFAGLMPHAPILVPGVARERLAEVAATVQAMTTVSSHAMAAQADTVVLISPHSPRQPGAFGIWQTRRLRGSLEKFGSPEDHVDLPLDRAFAERLETTAARRGLRTWRITGEPLDHGAMVPLCYLVSAGWKGPTVILSLNDTADGGCDELGEAIAATAQELNRRTAIIASGDMSHRLTSSAPCGYHPEAHRFDETFIALLREGAFRDLRRIDASLQEMAAQDVADSTTVALAATGYRTDGHAVLSYEGPFGVGYGVAILFEPKIPAALRVDERDRRQNPLPLRGSAGRREMRGRSPVPRWMETAAGPGGRGADREARRFCDFANGQRRAARLPGDPAANGKRPGAGNLAQCRGNCVP